MASAELAIPVAAFRAVEKGTGKSKQIAAARKRLEELYASRLEDDPEDVMDLEIEPAEAPGPRLVEMPAQELAGKEEAEKLLERSRGLLGKMHADDVEEVVALHERIAAAIGARDAAELKAAAEAVACPVCRAAFRGTVECSRCEADLRPLMEPLAVAGAAG